MNVAHAVIALAVASYPLAAAAQPAAGTSSGAATLTVGGDAGVERSPDIGRLAVTIVTNDDAAVRSAGKNTAVYDALKARTGALGIASSALRTTAFNVRFVPYPPKDLPPAQRESRYGYVTSRSVAVDVTPIENVGKVVDAANAAGVTDIGDVSFDLRDRKSAYREALGAAFADAKANAAALARAGSLHILRVKAVTTENPPLVRPFGGSSMMRAAAEKAPAPTQIEPNGLIEIPAHVTVVYEVQ